MKSIAFFDFDGTITYSDTLLQFIKFAKGKAGFYTGFLLNSPYLISYKIKLIPNQLAKEKVLQYFFRNMSEEDFSLLCDRFSDQVLPALVRPKAIEEIKKHQQNGTEVVVVSASPENWILKWANANLITVISSQLEIKENRLTGKLSCANCYGEEKVRRIKEKYQLSDYDEIFAYGDTSGDLPMLNLATKAFFKPFR
ncbi:MAG TPA: HAD family hydrolase [Flavisolibacter sp.]|nr:HAD family hydrolase [Flavisolibacter sp.]